MCGYCIDVSGRIYGQVNILIANIKLVFICISIHIDKSFHIAASIWQANWVFPALLSVYDYYDKYILFLSVSYTSDAAAINIQNSWSIVFVLK